MYAQTLRIEHTGVDILFERSKKGLKWDSHLHIRNMIANGKKKIEIQNWKLRYKTEQKHDWTN